MGLQLSILVGCVGALELLACLKHVFVCVFKFTDDPSNCCIDYFHRAGISDDFVMIEKSNLEDDKQVCSEIEAIFRKNKSEPDILCIGPPVTDCYVRIPTPIPFGVDDEIIGQKSSSNPSSLIDSGNENPTMQQSSEHFSVIIKQFHGSSSDISSMEDIHNGVKSSPKKLLRRSRTPEIHAGSCDDYDDGEEEEEDLDYQKKHHKPSKVISTLANKRFLKSKSRNSELGRSSENLSTTRRSKRHREPERCKSDIQIQMARNLLRDEWTNTSPVDSDCNLSRTSSKKSISVLIQTSFEDKLHFPERSSSQNSNISYKSNVCPNCRSCNDCSESKARQTTENNSVDGKSQLVKISSFEEASNDDYEKLKKVIGCGVAADNNQVSKDWNERIKSSIDSESHDDEFEDAVEVGLRFSENPIQYSIPDLGDNQAFWVIRRPYLRKIHIPFIPHFSLFACDQKSNV